MAVNGQNAEKIAYSNGHTNGVNGNGNGVNGDGDHFDRNSMLGHLGANPYDDEPAPPLLYFHSIPEGWVRNPLPLAPTDAPVCARMQLMHSRILFMTWLACSDATHLALPQPQRIPCTAHCIRCMHGSSWQAGTKNLAASRS